MTRNIRRLEATVKLRIRERGQVQWRESRLVANGRVNALHGEQEPSDDFQIRVDDGSVKSGVAACGLYAALRGIEWQGSLIEIRWGGAEVVTAGRERESRGDWVLGVS